MKKTLLVFLMCLVAALGVVLCACNSHEHTYDTAYESDATYHWHKATCEHSDLTDGKEAHTFDESGTCTKCGYKKAPVTHEHDRVLISEKPATCTAAGVKAHYICVGCDLLFDLDGKEVTAKDLEIAAKGHGNLIEHAAVRGTCAEEGTIAYWECPACGTMFDAKENGKELDDITGTKDPTNHASVFEFHPSTATCVTPSARDYYECPDCHKKYDSRIGGTELTEAQLAPTVNANKHAKDLVYHEAKNPTCSEKGNVAYYECTDCYKKYDLAVGGKEIKDVEIAIKADAHKLIYHPYSAATCQKAGNNAYWECEYCDKKFSEKDKSTELQENEITIPIAAHVHPSSLEYHEGTKATCTTKGEKTYWECDQCHNKYDKPYGGDLITETEIPVDSNNHATKLEYHQGFAATCTQKGQRTYYECTSCNKKFDKLIGGTVIEEIELEKDPTNHVDFLEYHPEVSANCQNEGIKAYWHCKNCNKDFDSSLGVKEIGDKTIAKDPNKHPKQLIYHSPTANCITEGYEAYWQCDDCHKMYDKAVNGTEIASLTLAKNPNRHATALKRYGEILATCSTEGRLEYWVCTKCNVKYTDKDGKTAIDNVVTDKDPDRHAKIKYVAEIAATCTTTGSHAHYECENPECGKMFTDPDGKVEMSNEAMVIAALGHDYTRQIPQYDEADPKKGHTRVCVVCGTKEEPVAHNYSNGICTACGYNGRHEHTLTLHPQVNATCVKDGMSAYYECDECNDSKYYRDEYGIEEIEDHDSLILKATGNHSYSVKNHDEETHWLECATCGAKDQASIDKHVLTGGICTNSEKLVYGSEKYDQSYSSKYYSSFYLGCGSDELVEDNGYYYAPIEEDGITHYYLRKIEGLNIQNPRIALVTVPETITVDGEEEDVYGIFSLAVSTYIYVTALVLPEDIVIYENAFGSVNLTTLYYCGTEEEWEELKESLNNTNNNYLMNCSDVYTFSDEEPEETDYGKHWHYGSEDKVELWEQHQDPANVDDLGVYYILSDDEQYYIVSNIRPEYFSGSSSPIIIVQSTYKYHKEVKEIYGMALGFFDKDYSVVIPKSINKFSSGVSIFTSNSHIKVVYYEGDKDSWDKIENHSYTDSAITGNSATLAFYSETQPDVVGDFWHWNSDHTAPEMWAPVLPDGGAKMSGTTVTGVLDGATHVVIPETATAIETLAFADRDDLEYIIIPTSINELRNNGMGMLSPFRSNPCKLFYKGNEDEWSKISRVDDAVNGVLYNNSIDHLVYFFSETAPTEIGLFWHFDGDGKTPMIWEETKDGDKLPEDIITENGLVYALDSDFASYSVVECIDLGASLIIIEEEIYDIPVIEIINYVFEKPTGNMIIVIPSSIEYLGEGYAADKITCFYCGCLEDWEDIEDCDDCEITDVYFYTEGDIDDDGHYWTYDDDDIPVIFEYKFYDDESGITFEYDPKTYEATAISYTKGTRANIIIPENIEIDGVEYTVTAIGDRAFTTGSGSIGIVIPDTVETIGVSAFDFGTSSYQRTVEWVVFGSGLKSIGQGAFWTNRTIGGYPNSPFKTSYTRTTFSDGRSASTEVIKATFYIHGSKEDWEDITEGFYDWNNSAGTDAYADFLSLKANVEECGGVTLYYYAEELPEFGADKYWDYGSNGMPALNSVDLFTFEGLNYELNDETDRAAVRGISDASRGNYAILDEIKYGGKEYDVVSIFDDAFSSTNFASLIIPESVTSIGENAFKGRSNNFNLVIGDSVEEFGKDAFLNAMYTICYTCDDDNYAENEELAEAVGDDANVTYYSEYRPAEHAENYWHYTDRAKIIPEVYSEVEVKTYTDAASGVIYEYYDATSTATAIGYDANILTGDVLNIPARIGVNGKPYTVTAIGPNAFYYNYSNRRFTKIILPDTIKLIDDRAFYSQSGVNTFVVGIVDTYRGSPFYSWSTSTLNIYLRPGVSVDAFKQSVANDTTIRNCNNLCVYSKKAPPLESEVKYWHFTNTYETETTIWYSDGEKSVTVDQCNYTINTYTKKAILTRVSLGTSQTYDFKIPEKIEYEGDYYTVVEVAQQAIANSYVHLRSLEIPKTVKKLGPSAVYYQTQYLQYIVLHADLVMEYNAFYGPFYTAHDIKIYFNGTEAEYDTLLSDTSNPFVANVVNYRYLNAKSYIYSETEHECNYGLWNYNEDGSINEVKQPA